MMRMLESGIPEEEQSKMTPGEGTHELTSTPGGLGTDSILDEQKCRESSISQITFENIEL